MHLDPAVERSPAVPLDRAVRAHGQSSGIIQCASAPVGDLHRAGLLTSVRSAPGLDGVRIDVQSRPIDATGRGVDTLAILGPLTEGSRYYNHYLANTNGPCRLLDDADLVVRRMLGLPLQTESTGLSCERLV